MFKSMTLFVKIALILGVGCIVADIVAMLVGTAKPLSPIETLILDFGCLAAWIYVAILEHKLVKAEENYRYEFHGATHD